MKINVLATIAAAIALNFASAAHAQSTIVDISATSGVAATASFAAGTYNVSWIDNTANGGYNGWTYQFGNPNVREAFDVTIGGQTFSIDFDSGSTSFNSFATAGQALSAVNSGPYVTYAGATDGNVVTHVGGPLQFTLASASTISFGIPDFRLVDNTGGVSLAITAAVPEPETYALMLAGLVATGFFARRRKAV